MFVNARDAELIANRDKLSLVCAQSNALEEVLQRVADVGRQNDLAGRHVERDNRKYDVLLFRPLHVRSVKGMLMILSARSGTKGTVPLLSRTGSQAAFKCMCRLLRSVGFEGDEVSVGQFQIEYDEQ